MKLIFMSVFLVFSQFAYSRTAQELAVKPRVVIHQCAPSNNGVNLTNVMAANCSIGSFCVRSRVICLYGSQPIVSSEYNIDAVIQKNTTSIFK
jgi:hypothetical protein